MCCEAPLRLCVHFLALCDLPETKNFEKNRKNFGFFFHFFPHAGTVEENT